MPDNSEAIVFRKKILTETISQDKEQHSFH